MALTKKYIDWIKQKPKAKLLHDCVETKLIEILNGIIPTYHPIREPQGLAGGRNDLLLFEFSGKKVLFEVIGTKSQVSRDLRILDKTKADVKIAVIIDKEVDHGVVDQFLKENPEDPYPYIFIGELFNDSLLPECILKLKEFIKGDKNIESKAHVNLDNVKKLLRRWRELFGTFSHLKLEKEIIQVGNMFT